MSPLRFAAITALTALVMLPASASAAVDKATGADKERHGGKVSSPGKSAAELEVVFTGDYTQAGYSGDKGLSHYIVTDCEGVVTKVDLRGEHTTYVIGPFASGIASLTVKAGTTVKTYETGACPGDSCTSSCDENFKYTPSELAAGTETLVADVEQSPKSESFSDTFSGLTSLFS